MAVLLLVPTVMSGQIPASGTLEGTVVAGSGLRLAAAAVTLRGPGSDRHQLSGEDGHFRFVALDPGAYRITGALEGFATVELDIEVTAGRTTTVALALPQAVDEEIDVKGASSILGSLVIGPGATLTRRHLDELPTGEDPWTLLRQSPGVFLDRVDVAGSESANPTIFRAAAVDSDQNDMQIDGVSVEASGLRYNSLYFDMAQFSEMQVRTGGSDISQRTSGVAINLTMRRGSSPTRGSVRYQLADADGYFGVLEQSTPQFGAEDLGPGQGAIVGTQIVQLEDAGLEVGGPAIADRLWWWGSVSRNDLANLEWNGWPTETELRNQAFRLNSQISGANALQGTWSGSQREEYGLGALDFSTGPGAITDLARDTDLLRLRDTHVFSSDLFFDLSFGWSDSDETYLTRGGAGPDLSEAVVVDGVWSNQASGWLEGQTRSVRVDGSKFLSGSRLDQNLGFGAQARRIEEEGDWAWPGREIVSDPAIGLVVAHRGIYGRHQRDLQSLWFQDTLRWGRLSFNGGLRWDREKGRNRAVVVKANPAFPELLPEIVFPGEDAPFTWQTVAPRLGVTWEVKEGGRTRLQASLGRFTDQLSRWQVNHTDPTVGSFAFMAYPSTGEPYQDEPTFYLFGINFDPDRRDSFESPNRSDPGLEAPILDELILSVDHALAPTFAVGARVTARQARDVLDLRRLVEEADGSLRALRIDEWAAVGNVEGAVPGTDYDYSEPVFAPLPGVDVTGGRLIANGDRERHYLGATLTATKRLSDNWMLDAFAEYGRGEWQVSPEALLYGEPNRVPEGGSRDGDLFFVNTAAWTEASLPAPTADRGVRSLQSSWRANVSGMVRIAPERVWGFELAGSVMAREGYPLPFQDTLQTALGSGFPVAVTENLDDFRLDDLLMVDLRLKKEIAVRHDWRLSLHLDGFNLANETPAQSRNPNLAQSTALWVSQTVSPRVYRLGLRLNFR